MAQKVFQYAFHKAVEENREEEEGKGDKEWSREKQK